MDGCTTTRVQTLIDQFELMAQSNATPAAPRSWSVSGSKKRVLPPQPMSDNSPVKEIIERINMQRSRTQSEPVQLKQKTEEVVQLTQKTEEVAEPVEEPTEEQILAVKSTPTKPAFSKRLTVETDDDVNYQDESDVDSMTTTKTTYYSTVPRSPSAYSTASTGSLDSLLSSLDIFLPELLQASGESSPDISKVVRPTVYHSRRSSLPENLQSTKTSKLIPPTSYRRSSLTSKPPSTTTKDSLLFRKESSIPVPKSRRPSKTAVPVAPKPARLRCSSHAATLVPPAAKSTRRITDSVPSAPSVITPSCARSRSNLSSVPRYMNYDSSPRFAATKAMNLERRRQLEERNRNLAADRTKHCSNNTTREPRTPEWQGRLDQVRSRLFDFKESNQALATKSKTTVPRSRSASHSRV